MIKKNIFTWCFYLILFASTTAIGQNTALPPAAQEAYNKGITAAKLPDYPLAIRYFEEARKAAPESPEVFFNLGLAESKIPGRELRAICWFGAYLSTNPAAANAAAIKEQISVLDMRSQSNLSQLLKSVQAAANEMSDQIYTQGDSKIRIGDEKRVYEMAILWVDFGDIANAQKAVDFIKKEDKKSYPQWYIVQGQAKAGDIRGAQKTVDLIKDTFWKSSSYEKISKAQVNAGDFAGAQKTAGLIQNESDKSSANLTIGIKQARNGDIPGAQKTSELIPDSLYRGWVMGEIARSLTKKGDLSGANNIVNLIKDTSARSAGFAGIAEVQAEIGDINGAKKTLISAQKTAELMHTSYYRDRAQNAIVKAQIKIGDIAGAQKTAELIQDAQRKGRANEDIARAQGKTIAKIMNSDDWIQRLDDDNKKNDCPLNTQRFLDLAGYLKSLPPPDYPELLFIRTSDGRYLQLPSSGDPYRVFESLYETAEKIVKAQNVIEQMMKEQTKK